MIIKKYSCKRFAGLKDKEIDFQGGLNVILGPNEAGKSTLVEGIHSVLFKPSKLGFRTSEDKEFRNRFMPLPSGDSIDGELIVASPKGDYILSKEWGSDPKAQLVVPTDHIIKNEDSINDALKDLLIFGEGTYSSIFFSKQANLKHAIENIMNNREATSEVSSLLRRAIMELDGVSLDKLAQKIDTEIDILYKRWDIEKNYPENNRGISNPFKVGFGEIVSSFYKKEGLKLEMDKAKVGEKEYNEICDLIKDVESRISELIKAKDEMEMLENDVIQRSILEPKIQQFDKDIKLLTKINQEWPRNEEKLKQLDLEISKLTVDLENLESEKMQANKVAERRVIASNIEKINSLNEKINSLKCELNEIKPVTKEQILELEKNHNEMMTTEAMMKAGVIIGKLNFLNSDSEMTITKDLEQPTTVKAGDCFKANGYIKLQCEDLFELEIKSGDMDFDQMIVQYKNSKGNYEKLLKECQVATIEEGKLNNERWNSLKRLLDNYLDKTNEILNGETLENLVERLDSYGDLSSIRAIELIDIEIKAINKTLLDLIADKRVIQSDINKWTEEYGNIDGLFDKIIDIKMNQKSKENELNMLAFLPEEYESTEDFRDKLTKTRRDYDSANSRLAELKEQYYERERNLSDSTYEELIDMYNAEENIFIKKLKKGEKLLKIKETFNQIRNVMDDASFNPVINAFSNYLYILTNGNYQVKDIDNNFNFKVHREDQSLLPLNLLSSGTYDSVSLALRLSILEYILGDNKGFVILDDCLVDLDPCRKEMAAKLINEFAKKHQVIFTTCSPDTATMLGGHLIELNQELALEMES